MCNSVNSISDIIHHPTCHCLWLRAITHTINHLFAVAFEFDKIINLNTRLFCVVEQEAISDKIQYYTILHFTSLHSNHTSFISISHTRKYITYGRLHEVLLHLRYCSNVQTVLSSAFPFPLPREQRKIQTLLIILYFVRCEAFL